MLELIRTPGLRRLFGAQLQSQLGTGAAYVALLLVAHQRLNSAWAIALVLLADYIPGIVLAPVCGALADRMSRRRLAVGADLLRAGAFAGLALTTSFAGTVVLALMAGIGTALFYPAVNSALPLMVSEDQRSSATALSGGINNLGITVGPGLTALVLLFSGPSLVLGINAVTFLLSAILLVGVPLGHGLQAAEGQPASVWADTRDGVRAAGQIPGMAVLLLLGAAAVLVGAMINVAEPLLAIGPLHGGSSGYAILVALYGAGMVLGAFITARAGYRLGELRRRWLLGLVVNGIAVLATALAPSLPFAMATFACTGLSNTLIVDPEIRLLQQMVAQRLLGRLMALRFVLQSIAMVVAFLAAGALLEALGVRAVFAVAGASLLLLTPVGGFLFRPRGEVASEGGVADNAREYA